MERVGVRSSPERLEPARKPVKAGKVRAKSSVAEACTRSKGPCMSGHELLRNVSVENAVRPETASELGAVPIRGPNA